MTPTLSIETVVKHFVDNLGTARGAAACPLNARDPNLNFSPTWIVSIENAGGRHALALVDETDLLVEHPWKGALSRRWCDEVDGLVVATASVLETADAWLVEKAGPYGVMDAALALYEILEASSIAGGWKIGLIDDDGTIQGSVRRAPHGTPQPGAYLLAGLEGLKIFIAPAFERSVRSRTDLEVASVVAALAAQDNDATLDRRFDRVTSFARVLLAALRREPPSEDFYFRVRGLRSDAGGVISVAIQWADAAGEGPDVARFVAESEAVRVTAGSTTALFAEIAAFEGDLPAFTTAALREVDRISLGALRASDRYVVLEPFLGIPKG